MVFLLRVALLGLLSHILIEFGYPHLNSVLKHYNYAACMFGGLGMTTTGMIYVRTSYSVLKHK